MKTVFSTGSLCVIESMKKIEEFAGYLTSLKQNGSELLLRLSPWDVRDDEAPVLLVKSESCHVIHSDGLTLESILENEYEVDELELQENKLSIWVYDFESPVEIVGDDISFQFVPYNHEEYKKILINKDKHFELYCKENIELRNKINEVESFICQHEKIILSKSATHPEGTEGHKIYKGQLKLLNKLKNKLNK